jgi:osmotically-inducible protein OsmY
MAACAVWHATCPLYTLVSRIHSLKEAVMRTMTFCCLLGLAALVGCDTTTTNPNQQDINKATNTDRGAAVETDNNGPPKPDNTAVNKRDADGDTKTPLDQSNASADIDKTAEIRRRVVDLPDMSVNARNVKIITDETGKVSLRGPVENQAEHDAIVKIAKEVAGNDNVEDQLEIKTKE